ncbi:DUF2079 domain-containing protein [Streptomyces sp. NPDC057654]|uniref:DUF2079 domain-containing protein n=1 Tax=Streptomyces sp. NPDC057654 TaxID=3346196 RepID=UPI0036A3C896
MDTAAAVATPGRSTAEAAPAAGARAAALRNPRLDPYWLAAALFIAFAALSICRYRRLLTMSWDLGIFEQAIRAYAHFQAPVADLKGPGANILGDHFSPVTALLAPFYRVFPTPVTLLVAQAVLFAVSVIPVARVAAHLLGRKRGLAIGLAFGLSWGVQRAVEFDFHEIAFAMPLIAFSLEAVLRQRWWTAVCWALPLVLVKEDLGLTVAAIGAVMLVRLRGKEQPRMVALAAGLVAFGLVAAIITFGVVIPGFNNGGSYDYWNKLNGDGGPAPTIPFDTAIRTLLWILLPTTGLLALRSPLLIVALPTLAWRFLSHDDHYWGIDWHYSAVLMPVVFIALVDALTGVGASPRAWLRSYAHHIPAAVAAAALALTTSLPLADLTEADTYRKSSAVSAVDRLLNRIPDNATVEANVGPISRLTDRCRVFWIGGTGGIQPDYVALRNDEAKAPAELLDETQRMHPGTAYTYLGGDGGYVVLRRTAPTPAPAAATAVGTPSADVAVTVASR